VALRWSFPCDAFRDLSFLLSCARIDLIAERRDHKSNLFPFYVRFLDGIAR
jgi:hypothetical protein